MGLNFGRRILVTRFWLGDYDIMIGDFLFLFMGLGWVMVRVDGIGRVDTYPFLFG